MENSTSQIINATDILPKASLKRQPDVFKDISRFDDEELKKLSDRIISQFAANYDPQDTKPKTTPSVVTVKGSKSIGLERLKPEKIEEYLWLHPSVPRGIEIKANRMISRGYTINPYKTKDQEEPSEKAKESAEEMRELIERSGGILRIKKLIQDGYGYGNAYATLVTDTDETKIVKLNQEHPIFFRISKKGDKKMVIKGKGSSDQQKMYDGDFKIDEKTRKPDTFTQVTYLQGTNMVITTGDEIPANRVFHLTFDTWGDEVEGISLVQYLYLTIKYLLNIEEAAAETMHRSGFTQKKVTTDIISEKDLRKMANNLKEINSKDAIILPKGSDVINLAPGTTQFKEYHEVFMRLIAVRLGIPLPLLLQDGTATNKATIDEQRKDMAADFRADETQVKQTLEEQVFIPACKLLYGESFEEFPTFEFRPVLEDKNAKIEALHSLSETIQRLVNSISTLQQAGYEDKANDLSDKLSSIMEMLIYPK